jgi:hypothetical protein
LPARFCFPYTAHTGCAGFGRPARHLRHCRPPCPRALGECAAPGWLARPRAWGLAVPRIFRRRYLQSFTERLEAGEPKTGCGIK